MRLFIVDKMKNDIVSFLVYDKNLEQFFMLL